MIQAQADDKAGPAVAGDYLVYIGEMELARGNLDEAVHEFSKALMVEPTNKKALHYLSQLGYAQNRNMVQASMPPTRAVTFTRTEAVNTDMDRMESQKMMGHQQISSAEEPACTDYMASLDERAHIRTLCDGTKWMDSDPWHSEDTFISHLGEASAAIAPAENRGSPKGSTTVFNTAQVHHPEPFANPQMAHITYPADPTDMLSKLKQTYVLENEYAYTQFLKNHYLQSQQEIANREDMIDAQHTQLAKLDRELTNTREDIRELLWAKEYLLNHTVREADYMQSHPYTE